MGDPPHRPALLAPLMAALAATGGGPAALAHTPAPAPIRSTAHPAHPVHPGASVWLQFEIRDGEVLLSLNAEQRTANPWFGVEGLHLPPVDATVLATLAEAAGRLIGERVVVEADGVALVGEVRGVECLDFTPTNPEPTVAVQVAFPCGGRPRTVRVRWDLFTDDGQAIPVLFRDEQDRFNVNWANLMPYEPEYTWHGTGLVAPRSGARRAPVAPGRPHTWPALSLALGAAALLTLALRGRRPLARVAGVLGLAAALALQGVGRVRSPVGPAVVMPSADQALGIFRALHATIYRAFEATTEEGIYATLAAAVDLDALDELYGEVYESLVLRAEGGAFCEIERVTPLAETLILDPGVRSAGDLAYEVEYAWRVDGSVTHWGHTHLRTNVYRARYTVAHDGEAWRIAAWDTLEHRREDDGRGFVTLVGEQEWDYGDEADLPDDSDLPDDPGPPDDADDRP